MKQIKDRHAKTENTYGNAVPETRVTMEQFRNQGAVTAEEIAGEL
jgi:hypothetical protein